MYERSGFRITSDFTALITFFYAFSFMCVLTGGVATVRRQLKKAEDEECKEDEQSLGNSKKYKKMDSKKDDDSVSMGSESLLSSYFLKSPENASAYSSTDLSTNKSYKRNRE